MFWRTPSKIPGLFWIVLHAAGVLARYQILLFPKGLRNGTLEVAPKEGVKVGQVKAPRWPDDAPPHSHNSPITKFGVQMIFPSMRQTGRGHNRAGNIRAGCLLFQSQYWHRFSYGDVFVHMFPISHCSSVTPLNPLKFVEATLLHTAGYVVFVSIRTNEIYRITSN
jgi:hypothetical protein